MIVIIDVLILREMHCLTGMNGNLNSGYWYGVCDSELASLKALISLLQGQASGFKKKFKSRNKKRNRNNKIA